MSIKCINLVYSRKIGSPTRKTILQKLADSAGDDGRNAYPSLSRIANETETCRATVKRALAKLTEDGLISLDRKGGGSGRKTNSYRLNLAAIEQLEPSHPTGFKTNRVQNEPGSCPMERCNSA